MAEKGDDADHDHPIPIPMLGGGGGGGAVVGIDVARVLPNFFRGYLQSLVENHKFNKQQENDDDKSITKHPHAEGQKQHSIIPPNSILQFGGFQTIDSGANEVGKPYGLFQAQLPYNASEKVQDLSQKIPLILRVKLVPRETIETGLIDLGHVAMFFIPSDDFERSKKDFASLVELMENQNSMMFSCIDGNDLIIFTSKQRHGDAQDFAKQVKTDQFICGVFHPVKNNQTVLSEHVQELTNIDDDKAANMEMEIDTKQLKTGGTDSSHTPIYWIFPPASWLKLNIEAYLHENRGFSTAAGIIRDSSGMWVLGYSFNLKCREISVAEMYALFYGIRTLWDSGYKKVLVESNFKPAVDFIKAGKSHGGISKRCIDLINRDWNCEISYVDSEANMSANWLATHPQDCDEVVVFWKPPRGVLPIYLTE